MSLQSLVYNPLLEEETNLTGWSKSTIDYVIKNRLKIHTSIRGIAKSLNKILQKADVEDLYTEILDYLYNCDDYNISKAYERSSNVGVIVSLEGYVHSCVKYCVIRYVTEGYNDERPIVREFIKDDDGKELSLFDTIADKTGEDSYNNIGYQLEDICRAYENQRYTFGPDIFQIWFIRLQTIVYDKQDSFKDILTVLGISKRDIAQIEKMNCTDGVMISIAKAVTLLGIEESINVLRDYTYSADRIEKVIALF